MASVYPGGLDNFTAPVAGQPRSSPNEATLLADLGDAVEAIEAAIGSTADAWTAYTPTNSGLTLGNGLQSAAYRRVGRTCHVRWRLQLGTTSAVTAAVMVGLPFTVGGAEQVGSAYYNDAGTRLYTGACTLAPGASMATLIQEQTGQGFVNATSPFTWTTNDVLVMSVTYETA